RRVEPLESLRASFSVEDGAAADWPPEADEDLQGPQQAGRSRRRAFGAEYLARLCPRRADSAASWGVQGSLGAGAGDGRFRGARRAGRPPPPARGGEVARGRAK